MSDNNIISEVNEEGEYILIKVKKEDIGSLSDLISDKDEAPEIMSFWGSHKDYCARCNDGTKKKITAKNGIEAAIVGIAKCGGPCQVSRGTCD